MIRLKISKHSDEEITLEALEGIDHFGFGTFLINIQPDEIECDSFSKQILLAAKYQDGMNGLEIWKDNRIAWGDPSEAIIMLIEEISKHEGADVWLSEIPNKYLYGKDPNEERTWLSADELKEGYLYEIQARCAKIGIWKSEKGEFTISRFKFGLNYIFEEIHWDLSDAFGTAKPIREIEKVPVFNNDKEKETLEYLNTKATELNLIGDRQDL